MILLLIDFGMDDLVITIVIAVIFIINLDALDEAGSRPPQIYLRYSCPFLGSVTTKFYNAL